MRLRNAAVILLPLLAGCTYAPFASAPWPLSGPPTVAENPLFVPVSNQDFVWEQVVDSIDDHFEIKSEERVQVVGNVLTEGRLETYPAVGSTLFEPWRRDSTPGFEKLHATLQSIRRQAFVRVTPFEHGALVHLTIAKELEAVDQSGNPLVGSKTPRHDGSLLSRSGRDEEQREPPSTWVPLGRDVQLEQRLLTDIRNRLAQ